MDLSWSLKFYTKINDMGHNFKKLIIWEKSMDLCDLVFKYVIELPKNERYNLIDQMNRSSCSIPSNIAEGSGKRSNLQFAEYLSIAISSAYELETQLLICERRKYGISELLKQLLELVTEVQKMIYSYREKILNSNS
jgi:four helix bundle protein